MKKIILIALSLIILISTGIITFFSCSKVSNRSYNRIEDSVKKTNWENTYSASFVLEVKDVDTQDLIMFVQGTYSINKNDGTILCGELVQTVYNTPSSFKIGFYDDTYVTLTDEYKVLSDLEEEVLLSQFMCSPAISLRKDEIESIKKSEVSDGNMYTVIANENFGDYLSRLLGDDIYTFSSMKQPKKEMTEYSDLILKYIIGDDGFLIGRETSYIITAYDTVPYYPGYQANDDDFKRTFSISLKHNYKAFGGEVSVDISPFLPDDETESEN